MKEAGVRHYIAIAGLSDNGKTGWIGVPGLNGVASTADGREDITRPARDALISAIEAGVNQGPAIENGVIRASDRGEFEHPLVVPVAYEPAVAAP